MIVKDIEIFHKSGNEILMEKNGKYIWKDIEIVIRNNSRITLKSNCEHLFGFDIHIVNEYFKEALIIGDTWERAYGDLCWSKNNAKTMPWYFAAYENGKTYGFGVKTQPNAMCSWQCNKDEIVLRVDIRNGISPICLKGSTLNVCEVVLHEGDGDVHYEMREFCKEMCDNPSFPKRQIFGGNDWYCNYGDNSFDKILTHTKRIAECSKNCTEKPFMVIDDGWEILHHQNENDDEYYNGGPWRYANDNFGDMKKMAEAIENEGAIPGIWFRPLWTVEKYPKEYILKSKGIKDTLDPSHPEVLKLIKRDIGVIKNWGYKLIKHDFTSYDIFGCWGFEMTEDIFRDKIQFYDQTKTTAQIIKKLYTAMREAAGDDILIMGCNTISHLSAGIFDIQRTGDDTSGLDFERTKKYGVNTLAFRMCQHNSFYAVDADCVGITDKIPWQKNKQWLDVLSKSGTPLFVSIAEDCYTEEIKKDITVAMETADKNNVTSKPLDWFETKTPKRWESGHGIDEYEW